MDVFDKDFTGAPGRPAMTSDHTRKALAGMTLASVMLCLAAAVAPAQSPYQGAFSLPFAVQWGGAVLPPGDYSFTLEHSPAGATVTVRGTAGVVTQALMCQGGSVGIKGKRSELVLVRNEGQRRIRTLRLADADLVLEYSLPAEEAPLLATGPRLLQRVPVTAATGADAAGITASAAASQNTPGTSAQVPPR
jgi:hypothetical protein